MFRLDNSVNHPTGIQSHPEPHHDRGEPSQAQRPAAPNEDLSTFALHNDPQFETRDYRSVESNVQKYRTRHLDHRSKTFTEAMKDGVFSVRSGDLVAVVKQVEKTRDEMTFANLEEIEKKIRIWIDHHPREYVERGGDTVARLLRDIGARKKDPLLGMAGNAHFNSDLLKLVRDIYGDQVAAFLTRVAPGLETQDSANIETRDLLRQVLETPYLKSFMAAQSMVTTAADRAPGPPFSDADLSRITEQVAKLPVELISLLKDQSIKIVTTKESIDNHLRVTTKQRYDPSVKTASGYYTGAETREVVLAMHLERDGWKPPINLKNGFSNPTLFHIGAALDNTVGKALLGHPLRRDPEFIQCWEADRSRFDRDKMVGDVSYREDEMGLRTAFSEGIALAFKDRGNERTLSLEPEWPAINNYMINSLPKRLIMGYEG